MSESPSEVDAPAASWKPNWTERGHLTALQKFRDKPPGATLLVVRGALMSATFALVAGPVGLLFGVATHLFCVAEFGAQVAPSLPIAVGVAAAVGIVIGVVSRDLQEVRSFIVSWPLFRRVLDFGQVERLLGVHEPNPHASVAETRADDTFGEESAP